MAKTRVIKELWVFMMQNKKWWLAPIIIMFLLLGLLMFFAQSASVVPFIYALF